MDLGGVCRAVVAISIALAVIDFDAGPASAQVDPIVTAFQHCRDDARAAEQRIKSCMVVINASGIEPDEIAFAYIDLGTVYASEGDHDAELAAYNKALSIRGDIWQGLLNRGTLLLNRGEFDLALADYQHMKAIKPQELPLFRPEAGLDYRTQIAGNVSPDTASDSREQAMYEVAVAQFKQYLLQAFTGRCRSRAVAGVELNGALKDCNQALEIDGTNISAFDSRALVQLKLGNLDAALGDSSAALAKDPKNALSLFVRGTVERLKGKVQEGDADIAAAQAIAPESFKRQPSAITEP